LVVTDCGIRSSVYPSAGARTAASMPILVPAPGRFSMTNGCPSRPDNCWPTMRAMISKAPPGATGTMMRTGRVG
jgi:hypothetical protein